MRTSDRGPERERRSLRRATALQRTARALALAVLGTGLGTLGLAACGPGIAFACGVCDADRIAGVYDHAQIERVRAQRGVVLFLRIETRAPRGPAEVRRALVRAARAEPASAPASWRVAADAKSVAFVPRALATGVPALLARLNARLAADGIVLRRLRAAGDARAVAESGLPGL